MLQKPLMDFQSAVKVAPFYKGGREPYRSLEDFITDFLIFILLPLDIHIDFIQDISYCLLLRKNSMGFHIVL